MFTILKFEYFDLTFHILWEYQSFLLNSRSQYELEFFQNTLVVHLAFCLSKTSLKCQTEWNRTSIKNLQPQRNKYCICRFIGVKSFEKVKYSTWAENTLEIQL